MYDFSYHRPSTVDEAVALLAGSPDAKLLAGGQTLLPTMKARLANPSDIIDLSRVAALSAITEEGGSLVIGALAKHGDVATSPVVKAAIPAIAALAAIVGDPAVRSRGTIGGSVANNDPAADYPAACLALGATITTNKRSIAAADYFRGLFETALGEGEMITKVNFPKPKRAAYEKFRNPASRYAMVGVFVADTADGVRVAVTGAGQGGVFRATALETALASNFAPAALDGVTIDPATLIGDIHADSDYRAHLIVVMAKRAVTKAAQGA